MIYKNSLMLFAALTAPIQTYTISDAKKFADLENRIAMLEGSGSFFKIRSLQDAAGWGWNNKGTIFLTAGICVTACAIKRLCEGVSNQEFREQVDRTDQQYAQTQRDLQVLLTAVNRVGNRLGETESLTFDRKQIAPLSNQKGILISAINWVGDAAISATSRIISTFYTLT